MELAGYEVIGACTDPSRNCGLRAFSFSSSFLLGTGFLVSPFLYFIVMILCTCIAGGQVSNNSVPQMQLSGQCKVENCVFPLTFVSPSSHFHVPPSTHTSHRIRESHPPSAAVGGRMMSISHKKLAVSLNFARRSFAAPLYLSRQSKWHGRINRPRVLILMGSPTCRTQSLRASHASMALHNNCVGLREYKYVPT